MSNQTYGRGQVEWALWRAFGLGRPLGDDIPKVFRTRIKRLLEIDRDLDFSNEEVAPEAEYAFAQHASVEQGELSYTGVDAFCLGVGLDLLDAGFKQSEVVFLMRYLRRALEVRFEGLVARPSFNLNGLYRTKDYPSLPEFEQNGKAYADARVFIVISKVEIKEVFPIVQEKLRSTPMFLEPRYCEGATALAQTMSELMPDRRRVVVVLELTAVAQSSDAFLQQAPEIKRGRPKA